MEVFGKKKGNSKYVATILAFRIMCTKDRIGWEDALIVGNITEFYGGGLLLIGRELGWACD